MTLTCRNLLKAHLSSQGLSLSEKDEILNFEDRVVATVSDYKFESNELTYTVQPLQPIKFIEVKLTIGNLDE